MPPPSPPLLRFLALDVGDRWVGVASGSRESGLARPLAVLDRRGAGGDSAVLRQIRGWLKTESAGCIVVGDPVNMDGTVGPRAELSRAFARQVKRSVRQARVVLCDERLSSMAADAWMERDGLRGPQRKAWRDAYAAAVILLDYFAENHAGGPAVSSDPASPTDGSG